MRSGREHRPPEQAFLAAPASASSSAASASPANSSRTPEAEKGNAVEKSSSASATEPSADRDTGERAVVTPPAAAPVEGDDPAAQLAAVRLELRRISHDLKNSLHAWSLRMDLLARQVGLPETDPNLRQLAKVLDRIGGSVDALRALAHGGRPPT
jgi:hypothetical protein